MHAPVTHETTRLDHAAPRESTVGVSLETQRHKLKIVYKRSAAAEPPEHTPARMLGVGLILGGLILFGALGYGLTIGSLVLSALVVIAFYHAGKAL